jgi:hypothetical protein
MQSFDVLIFHPVHSDGADKLKRRILAESDSAYDELSALLKIVRDRDFTHAESIQHGRIIRRIAVISSALHGNITSALTDDERAWPDLNSKTGSALVRC